ncbi:aspartyl-tRNA synthetase domain protein [Mycobacterium ulcerans str. Harvey]|uniref:Aspartyl-tRNA synthetase domain protein n=1 Tax=Mycobacterium ulcerans str. Harvey TaxID=1299332 RepID=A0ABN0R118_MYCUL|nr:aspartyl-tRNA synthetase domain protein [Mycobacterium ulcerans str. Harvey]
MSRSAISMRAAPSSARDALTGPAEKKMQSPDWRHVSGQSVTLGIGQVLGHRPPSVPSSPTST